MMPVVGQHVKCILRTGAMAEGIVEEWLDDVVQLRSLDGESVLIIPHPNDDIILIKIVLSMVKIDSPVINEINDSADVIDSRGVQIIEGELNQKYQEAIALPIEDPKRVKTLAELRIMMAAQEKKIISEKVKNHHITETPKVQYGQPRFLKKQSPK